MNHGKYKKKHILTTAQKDYIKSNYTGINGKKIAKELGVSIYYVFEAKKELGLKREAYKKKVVKGRFFNVKEFQNWVA